MLYPIILLRRRCPEGHLGGKPLLPNSNGLSPLCASHLSRYTSTSCGPPPIVKLASPCSRIDRPDSALLSMTNRSFLRRPLPRGLRASCFRFGFLLAIPKNSLALASRRKPRHWLNYFEKILSNSFFNSPKTLSRLGCLFPYSFRFFSHSFPSAFQHSLTLLIRYRSDASYLDLGVDSPIFVPSYRRALLSWIAPFPYI